jgi:hypothetical protein
MKPFDLEAAQRGEPIEYLIFDKWVKARFLGLGARGTGSPIIEYQTKNNEHICYVHESSQLRMAPGTVAVRYRVALCQGPHDQYVMAVQEGDPEPQLRACGFIQWLSDWQTAEIKGDE